MHLILYIDNSPIKFMEIHMPMHNPMLSGFANYQLKEAKLKGYLEAFLKRHRQFIGGRAYKIFMEEKASVQPADVQDDLPGKKPALVLSFFNADEMNKHSLFKNAK